jgi:hypothetical protein
VQLEKLTTDAQANPLDMSATSARHYPTASWAWSKHKPVPRSQGRSPVRADCLRDVAVHEVLQIRELLGLGEAIRVLVLEPHSPLVGHRLRASGLAGECWALVRRPSSAQELQNEPAYDQVIVSDWPSVVSSQEQVSSQIEFGRFDVIVCLELSRIFSHEGVVDALEWATSTLLSPFGYLVSGEPLPFFSLPELESRLLKSSLLLAADERVIETDWSWSVTRWQRRPGASAQISGRLSLATMKDVEQDANLRDTLISCYREVFGGDGEWGEWMYCISCERRYSRHEYEALTTRGQCVCRTPRPLVAYHTLESVLADMRHDLAAPENSHLYVRRGAGNQVDAFVWGSLSTAEEIAAGLLPRHGALEQQRLHRILMHQLAKLGITDPSPLIYHQISIGVLETVRNLSLVVWLFARMCQFALDHGTEYVVAATIPTVNSFKLLRSIGMEVVYTYPPPDTNVVVPPIRLREEICQDDGRSMLIRSALDDNGVILGGSVRVLLKNLSCQSDRTLVAQTLRYMKREKMAQPVVAGHGSGD